MHNRPVPDTLVEQSFERVATHSVAGRYLLHVPRKQEAAPPSPLLLFLHGAGERGTDVSRVALHGPPKIIREGAMELPFVVVAPQVPEGRVWSVPFLDVLIGEVCDRVPIDEDRIYVTGISMGGFGTWQFAMEFPHRFAAIAPICGGGTFPGACGLRHLPIWAFHGALDSVVPVSHTDEFVERLRECDGHIRYTRYADAGHDSWTRTYSNPALYEWLLLHRRGQPGPRDAEGESHAV